MKGVDNKYNIKCWIKKQKRQCTLHSESILVLLLRMVLVEFRWMC